MIKRFFLFIISMLILLGCSSKEKTYTIGVDPSWFPLELMGKESNLLAFSSELLNDISRYSGIHFERIDMNWDTLTLGLEEGKCDGILSSIYPYTYELHRFDFSDIYLHTGPVLIIKEDATLIAGENMEGQAIAVRSRENEALFTRLFPEARILYYNSTPNALNSLINGSIDGIALGHIPAKTLLQGFYRKKIKIATPLLADTGLRLIAMHDKHTELIEAFNRGLDEMRKSGVYEKLLKKWELYAL